MKNAHTILKYTLLVLIIGTLTGCFTSKTHSVKQRLLLCTSEACQIYEYCMELNMEHKGDRQGFNEAVSAEKDWEEFQKACVWIWPE